MTAITRPTRRTVLAMGLATVPLLSACAQVLPREREFTDPVRRESLGNELTLVALYEQALNLRADLQETLEPVLAAHRAHAEALRAGLPDPDAVLPTATQTVGVDVLESLRTAERAAVGLRTGACTRATDADLAALLCVISASEAQHVAVLADLS